MKLVSWNVNGIRAVLKKGFLDFVAAAQPDVLCLQEVRAHPEQVPPQLELADYRPFWNPAQKKGYSGTLTLSRAEPLSVRLGMDRLAHDGEGRLVTLELPDFFLVNVYTPNAQRGLTRLDYRTEAWEPDFLAFLKELEREKPVVICGDLNVAHKAIDLANPKSNANNAGFTPAERERMDRLIAAGFVDTFREFTAEGGHYTWWSQMGNARQKNIGWRIDYFCVSRALRPRLRRSYICPQVLGSDHCPIVLELD